jgi:hypothetical protein
MAKVVILDNKIITTKSLEHKDYAVTKFIKDEKKSYINTNQPVVTRGLDRANYPVASFITEEKAVSIQQVLPFRIRFSAIQIPAYSPDNVPPIPLQIIGFSNYIL